MGREEASRQTHCKVRENVGSRSTKAETEQGTVRKLRPKELDAQRDNFVRDVHREV